jgi:hypothetical protein
MITESIGISVGVAGVLTFSNEQGPIKDVEFSGTAVIPPTPEEEETDGLDIQ